MIRYTRKVFSVCLRHHPYPAAEGGSAQWSPPQPPTYMNEEELRRIANELLGVAHARWRGNARWPAPGILMNETHRRKVRVFHGHRASGLDTQITPPRACAYLARSTKDMGKRPDRRRLPHGGQTGALTHSLRVRLGALTGVRSEPSHLMVRYPTPQDRGGKRVGSSGAPGSTGATPHSHCHCLSGAGTSRPRARGGVWHCGGPHIGQRALFSFAALYPSSYPCVYPRGLCPRGLTAHGDHVPQIPVGRSPCPPRWGRGGVGIGRAPRLGSL